MAIDFSTLGFLTRHDHGSSARKIDWSRSPDVERHEGLMSGAWVVKGTRVPAESIVSNADDGVSAEEISSEIFPSVPVDAARRIIEFARADGARSS